MTDGPMEAAGAVDAKNAPTAPWKTHRTGFPQLPQAITILANAEEVTAKRCHAPDREALSLRRMFLGLTGRIDVASSSMRSRKVEPV